MQETVSWDFATTPQKAVYQNFYKGEKHGWYKVSPSNYPNVTKAQSWIPVGDLLFKIDDGGSELVKAGNIGVQGRIAFDIVVKTVRTASVDQDPVYVLPSVEKSKTFGSQRVVKNDEKAFSILGCGYDFTGDFVSTDYLKNRVLDVDSLNNYKRINRNDNTKIDIFKVEGNNTKELSSSYAEKLGGGASVSFLGVAFKHQIKKLINESSYHKVNTRTVSTKYMNCKSNYRIDYSNNLGSLVPFYTDDFAKDLDNLEKGALKGDAFIDRYGTHVMLGAVMGAFVDYSMSYSKSVSRFSNSITSASVSGISYKSGGELKVDDVVPKSDAENAYAMAQNATTVSFNNCVFNITGNQNSSSSGNGSGNGAFFGFGRIKSSYKNVVEENESTKIHISGAGGKEMYLNGLLSGDKESWYLWTESLDKEDAWTWCNYPLNTLVPVYMFAKTQKQSDLIKKAWIDYLKKVDGGKAVDPLYETYVENNTEVRGADNEVEILRGDAEISTKSGKESQFQLAFTPVNIDGGKVALAIRYKVSERKMEGRDSLLQLSKVVEMPMSNGHKLAVSPYTMTSYESSVMSITGEVHGWIDITEQLENCPFVETKSHRVLVRIDGNGSDKKNLKIKADFRVPVVFCK